MKKPIIILLLIAATVAGFFYWKKKNSDDEDFEFNPGGTTPGKKNSPGVVYKKLTDSEIVTYAREADMKLPPLTVPINVKTEFLEKLLTLQKESFISIFKVYKTLGGVSRAKGLREVIETTPGLSSAQIALKVVETAKRLGV